MRFWLPNFYDNYYKVCNQEAPSYLERTCNIRLCFPRYQDLPMMCQPLGLGCGLYIITPVGYCHLGRTDNVFLFFFLNIHPVIHRVNNRLSKGFPLIRQVSNEYMYLHVCTEHSSKLLAKVCSLRIKI